MDDSDLMFDKVITAKYPVASANPMRLFVTQLKLDLIARGPRPMPTRVRIADRVIIHKRISVISLHTGWDDRVRLGEANKINQNYIFKIPR